MDMEYTNLSQLQGLIASRVGDICCWVKVEIEQMNCSGGHYYLSLIEKKESGEVLARAQGRIWRYNASIISSFEFATGVQFKAGISVVLLAKVDYHPVYGLSLTIKEIDQAYSIGQAKLEKQRNIEKLKSEQLLERQKEQLALPLLPRRVAVITSADAAGYGDFVKHCADNAYGYCFDFQLFAAVVQGQGAPASLIAALHQATLGDFDVLLILRGGGSEADLACFDDYSLCREIALCPLPVLTAIGHERDYHIADMVAFEHFKTPTALADFLIEWTADVESALNESVRNIRSLMERAVQRRQEELSRSIAGIRYNLAQRIDILQRQLGRELANIRFLLGSRVEGCQRELNRSLGNIRYLVASRLALMDKDLELRRSAIFSADPRKILDLGYVLAQDGKGQLLKSARALGKGDDFALRFKDGKWNCEIKEIRYE